MEIYLDEPVYGAFDTRLEAPAMQIKATAGIGKTRAVIEELAKSDVWRSREVHYFAPDHQQAAEVTELAQSHVLRARHIWGRSPTVSSPGYCARHRLTEMVARLGLNIHRTLCNRDAEHRCPHFESCPYLEQWRDTEPAFRVLPHEYLYLHLPVTQDSPMYTPDLAIVDENIVQKSLGTDLSVGIDQLSGLFRDAAIDCVESGKHFRRALVERGVTKDDANREATRRNNATRPDITPSMSDTEISRQLSLARRDDRRALRAIYKAIEGEIEIERPFHAIEIVKDEQIRVGDRSETQHRVHVYPRKEIQVGRSVPLLLIDADADCELNQLIFDREIDETEILVERQAHVIQCYSTALSTHTLIKPDAEGNRCFTGELKKVATIVARELASERRVVVVMPKKVEVALEGFGELRVDPDTGSKCWHGAKVAHFGAIRGKNTWEDCDTEILVGRNEPSPAAIDKLARALFAEDEEPLRLMGIKRFLRRYRGYRMRSGSQWGAQGSMHFDDRCQKILELIRDRESLQAIDRIRLVHCDLPKRVIILSSVPLDILVDELWTLDELAENPNRLGPVRRLLKAWEREGMIPLGSRDLSCAFPELFPSEARAKDAIKGAKDHPMGVGLIGGGNQIEYIFGIYPHFRVATYRRAGQRGRLSRVLYDPDRCHDPRAALSTLLKEEIVKFEDTPEIGE